LWAFVAYVDYDGIAETFVADFGIVVVVEAQVIAAIDDPVVDIAFEFEFDLLVPASKISEAGGVFMAHELDRLFAFVDLNLHDSYC